MNQFMKMFLESINTVNGKGYRLTSKPRKVVGLQGFLVNISTWTPNSQVTPSIDSGFFQDMNEEQYQNLCSIYPEGYVWWNGLGGDESVTMSESEYLAHTQPQPQQPSTTVE